MTKKDNFSLTDKYNSYITFILNIDNGGSTTFFREERIIINDNLYNKMKNQYNSKDLVLLDRLKDLDNIVSVKWKLGIFCLTAVDANNKNMRSNINHFTYKPFLLF